MLNAGELGVHPPGSLGVGFYVHARAECLIGRCGDGITDTLKKSGSLNLLKDGLLQQVPLKGRCFANLLEADSLDRMPELLMVCCNPDQLGLFTLEVVRFLENLTERGRLLDENDIRRYVPIFLILPNGILHEQTVEAFEDQIQESRMMGRLSGVSDSMIAALLNRVVRGISLQAGDRRGSGKDTVYLLEKKGSLVFAGGGDYERERIECNLTEHGYVFQHARGVPGTRIEFDKAMISIVLNVGGLIHTVKESGDLLDLRMGDLVKDPSKKEFVERITRAVFDVGQATGAYSQDAKYEDVWAMHRGTILAFAGHVTSSLKYFRAALSNKLDSVKLFPNEEWILTPLAKCAARTGLTDEEALFGELRRRVQESMARAIRYRDRVSESAQSGIHAMKLMAQRNITIEVFEASQDDLVMVGTMLDDEHLIKLEMGIYLPDEQITRCKLNMVRAPFPVCHEVEKIAERLVGLRIERGVLNEISSRIGGRVGCSHIKEIATNIVYFAASSLIRRKVGVDPMSTEYVHKLPEERFGLTKELLRDSCLAYCQTTPQGLDERIGIRRIGTDHTHPLPLGDYETSFGVLLRDRAKRFKDRVYLRWRDGDVDHSLTWREFVDKIFQISHSLMRLGVRKGDAVAIISENRAEMYLFELAAMSIGAVSVTVFAGYHPPQIAYALEHSRPRLVVVSGAHQLEKIQRDHFPWVKKFFCMDANEESCEWGAADFAELFAGGTDDAQLQERVSEIRPEDICMIMYTSGTTGPPKGVRLRHRNLISQQKAISLIWDVNEKDVFMSYLPWHHSFGGLFERLMTLYNGSCLCLDDSRGRDIDRLIDNWKAFKPSLFFSVPRVHDAIVTRCREDAEAAKAVFGGDLRFVFTAGASLPAHIETIYRDRGIPVLEGWGLTETSPCVTLTSKERNWRSGYVGFPIPGVHVRIDEDQEIQVFGPNVMEGYHDDEEATTHRIDEEGWFRTGDLGEFTNDGLRILGRKDGAFKLTTGEKVHPLRIECVLVNESPYISQVIALGNGKDYVGALIYPDFAELREWAMRRHLPMDRLLDSPVVFDLYQEELQRINPKIEIKYQRLRRAVLAEAVPTLADGELTPSGKLIRKAVMRRYEAKIEALFADEVQPGVIDIPKQELQRT